jgi:hypothetical protein
MNIFEITYISSIGWKCTEEVKGTCEKDAILRLVDNLRENREYIESLINIRKIKEKDYE